MEKAGTYIDPENECCPIAIGVIRKYLLEHYFPTYYNGLSEHQGWLCPSKDSSGKRNFVTKPGNVQMEVKQLQMQQLTIKSL